MKTKSLLKTNYNKMRVSLGRATGQNVKNSTMKKYNVLVVLIRTTNLTDCSDLVTV